MKTTIWDIFSTKFTVTFTRAIIVAGFLFAITDASAQAPPPLKNPFPTSLDSWSFTDTNNWTSDSGYAPISYTNIAPMPFGDGMSVIINTNLLAWLQYNTVENGTNEITVDTGSVTFWFAPNWSSTNDDAGDGLGPQEYGRLLEIGGYTPDSSLGWWSIYVDDVGANIYFSSQTNDGSGNTYTISAPIDWTTNYWHFISLTYSPTNVSLYLDGQLMTNDPTGLSILPGDVFTNGFFVGSDGLGIYQAEGEIDDLKTYNIVLSTNQINTAYENQQMNYFLNPNNYRYMVIQSAQSSPSSSPILYQAISGNGILTLIGSASSCISSTNVWLTNVVASVSGSGTNMTMSLMFTIEGGSNGVPYDVFANSLLDFSSNTNYAWGWMGQGYQCNTYMLTNLPPTACFLILGTPQDTDGDGLTDAYELLVSKTNPNVADSNLDGILDSWEVLLGLNPTQNNLNNPSMRSNYSYDSADWLEGISGVRSGAISLDNEGNVLSVSQ